MKRLLAVPLVALALGLAACGDDEEPESAATPEATPTATEEAPAGGEGGGEATGGEGVTVQMGDNFFRPGQVTVATGETVTFTNGGQVAHNVVAEDAGIDSGTMQPDDEFELTPEDAGTISYVCTFHPGMEGSVTVE